MIDTEIIDAENEWLHINEIVDIDNPFELQIGICNFEHLKVCSCQKELMDRFQQVEYEKVMVGLTGDESQLVIESRTNMSKVAGLKLCASHCIVNNIRCPVEREIVADTIKHFDIEQGGNYRLNDSNVYLIMKSLINQVLSAHRMQLYSNVHGIIQEYFDKHGNTHYALNPVEDARNRVDISIIAAVEKLNNIVYGAKSLNLNVNTDEEGLMSVKDLFNNIRKLDSKDVEVISK